MDFLKGSLSFKIPPKDLKLHNPAESREACQGHQWKGEVGEGRHAMTVQRALPEPATVSGKGE